MAYVPEQDVKQIWQDMGDQKTWGSFKDALTRHQNIKDAEGRDLAGRLKMIADRMKSERFPDSAERLAEVLRQRLATYDDDTHPTF